MKKITCLVCIISLLCSLHGQNCGCTDPLASNYNAAATVNDGNCLYPSTTIAPTSIGELDSALAGTSGMIYWNGGYWTYNDHSDCSLYRIDTSDAGILETLNIPGIANYDTEEISQDRDYIYLGDFGNNAGTRQDLHILRISKESVVNHQLEIDTIYFQYEDQGSFTSSPQATDYDCEAFVVTADSIYVFTKQWASEKTSFYGIPKVPGNYLAHKHATYDVGGLITGATYIPDRQLVVMCGYDYGGGSYLSSLHPFIILLYDFQGDEFFSGNKRRLNFGTLVKEQIEAIATSNALDYYITNEHFTTTQLGITIDRPARLQKLDLSEYLYNYLDTTELISIRPDAERERIVIYPNPASDRLFVKDLRSTYRSYEILDLDGRKVAGGKLKENEISLSQLALAPGAYILVLSGKSQRYSQRFIVQ